MEKGRATVLSQSHISLASDSTIVAVASMQNVVDTSLITPLRKGSLIVSGEKVSMVDGVDRILLVSKASNQSIQASFNDQSCTFTADSQGYWIIGELYRHNQNTKFRHLSEYVSDEAKLAKYLKVDAHASLLSQALAYEHNAGADISNDAKGIVDRLKNKDFSEAGQQTKALTSKALQEGLSIFNRFKGKATNKAMQLKNKSFLSAITGTGALVAFSDGYASEDELSKVIQFINNSPDLNVFPEADVKIAFDGFVSQMRQDRIFGEGAAFAAISKYTDQNEAELIIALAVAVAAAEEGIDADERTMITRIATKLNVDATHYLS